MKPIINTLLIWFLLIPSAWSQQILNMSIDDFYREFKKYEYNDNIGRNPEVLGIPWDKEEFVTGEIFTTSNLNYSGIPMRYNIFANQIEFRNEEGASFFIGVPELIDHIMIGEEKYIYAPYSIGNRIEKGFFTVLTEGRVILLEKKNMSLLPAEPAAAYRDPVPPRFKRGENEYFLRILPAEAKRIRNKKELIGIIEDHHPDLERFIKKNKTRFNKAGELKALIEFYNSLNQ